jgi:hypothetical protein
MRDPVMSELRHAVREVISDAFTSVGYAKPRDIAREVCVRFPGSIHSVGTRLAEDALTEIARGILKKSAPRAKGPSQLSLPGLDAPIAEHLPDAISVPVGGEVGDDEDQVIYKPLSRATVADLKAHLQLLVQQIAADTRRHRVLKEVLDLALALGAADEAPVLDAIGSLSYRRAA